jgi:hypothetical protein
LGFVVRDENCCVFHGMHASADTLSNAAYSRMADIVEEFR